jgi:predicted NUDIX family NTP pyrophosphohydrolase
MTPTHRERRSAGLLLYRRAPEHGRVEVLLGHLGGPLWARKEAGAWTIPKGEHPPEESPLAAARREFAEELGVPAPDGDLIELGTVRQAGGKTVTAWAVEGDVDAALCASNTFTLEWPPRSGRFQEFPELDRVAWHDLDAARPLLVRAQTELIDRLAAALRPSPPG